MKVLLLDTAFAAMPIYDYLAAGGHDVWVMGNRPNDVLAKSAGEKWIEQDYSKVDQVRAHVARLQIDYVVPGCTDVSIDTCTKLQPGKYLLDPPEINSILSDKDAFRRLCRDLDLPAPLMIKSESFPRAGTFICKPVDAFSGQGVTMFDGGDPDALNEAYGIAMKASPSATVLIESFTTGKLYSCSAFVEKQKLVASFYVLEGSSANPFAVDTSYVVENFPAECASLLTASLEKMCSALQLKDGLLHTQFILGEDGRPSIIEVARRCPGDLYSLLIEYSTGCRYGAKYASYFIGAHEDIQPEARRYVLRHTVAAAENGEIFAGLRMLDPESVRAFFPIGAMGQELAGRQGSRAGILFCEAPSYAKVIEDYERFLARRAYRLG